MEQSEYPSIPMIMDMVKRLPKWLRSDLLATDPMLRERAEYALAAMIATLPGKNSEIATDD